jgi:hypothetical protein
MDHEKIKALLEEAVTATSDRQNNIKNELFEGMLDRHPEFNDDTRNSLEWLFNNLFNDAAENCPIKFPVLFPIFSKLCGNSGRINWSLVD